MMKKTLALAVVAICGLCFPAWAGEGYVGASYIDTSLDVSTEIGSYNMGSGGWKLFGGYQVMKYFAVEATYYDLGSFEQTEGKAEFYADVEVFDFSARGVLPLGQKFELFARLGYSSVDVDLREMDSSESDRTWELLYGVGAAFKIGEKFGIRAEWESWDVDASLDAWSLGAYFRF